MKRTDSEESATDSSAGRTCDQQDESIDAGSPDDWDEEDLGLTNLWKDLDLALDEEEPQPGLSDFWQDEEPEDDWQ